MKSSPGFLFVSIFLTVVNASAVHLPWSQLKANSDIEIDSVNAVSSWEPDGSEQTPVSGDCHWTQLEKLEAAPGTESARAHAIKAYLARCESQLLKDNRPSPLNLLQFINIDHLVSHSPYAHKVIFKLHDGRSVAAIVALKPDPRPRPLIVAVCGIYCNAGDSGSTRSFFMHLFEESPFNVVMIANSSGTEFSKTNAAIAWGGFDGGTQVLDVVHQILNSDLRSRVSTVHLAGFSLGSHEVLYASLYGSFPENNFPTISSTTAICPVIDLESSIQRGFSGALRGALYTMQARSTLSDIWTSIPFLNSIPDPTSDYSSDQLRATFVAGTTHYYQDFTANRPWPYAPFIGRRIETFADMADLNRFEKYSDQVRVPTLAIYAKDDEFVEPAVNSKVLKQSLVDRPNSQVGVVGLQEGNHCAVSASYGWRTMTVLLRSHILANDPAEAKRYFGHAQTIPLGAFASGTATMGPTEKIVSYGWQFEAGSNEATLRFRIFSAERSSCARHENHLSSASSTCSPEFTVTAPLSLFEGTELHIPRSDDEANAMSRWVNTNSWLEGADGREITGQAGAWPTRLRVRGVYEL